MHRDGPGRPSHGGECPRRCRCLSRSSTNRRCGRRQGSSRHRASGGGRRGIAARAAAENLPRDREAPEAPLSKPQPPLPRARARREGQPGRHRPTGPRRAEHPTAPPPPRPPPPPPRCVGPAATLRRGEGGVERGGDVGWRGLFSGGGGGGGGGLGAPSGDLHVVARFAGGVLVALLDGLGHGEEAAAASRAALPVLHDHAGDSPLLLVPRCHDALRRTRGVVMSLASFRTADSSMTWTGIGNVEGILLRARGDPDHPDASISVRGGVVGYQLPPLRAETLPVFPGDTLIMATDGIRSGFATGLAIENSPQEIAESILARFARGTDDAHIVVARYLGAAQ